MILQEETKRIEPQVLVLSINLNFNKYLKINKEFISSRKVNKIDIPFHFISIKNSLPLFH